MSLTRRFLKMVTATMTAVDPSSALGIAEGREFAHDSVYRVLQEGSWQFSLLALQQVQLLGGLAGGYLILDDSLIMRYSSGKLKLKKLKDSARGRYVYGFSVVLLIWTDGQRRIPIGFRIYTAQKGESSKIVLALELLGEAKAFGFRPMYVLFDSWYSAEQILNWLIGTGWLFVTQLRSNRGLDGNPVESYNHPYWVKMGKLSKVKPKIIVVRRCKRYFCSNDTNLNHKTICKHYQVRQQVEEAFRSLKQELGWEGLRYRTLTTLNAHLSLTLAAFAVIEHHRFGVKQSFYKYRRGLISGRIAPPQLFLDVIPIAA